MEKPKAVYVSDILDRNRIKSMVNKINKAKDKLCKAYKNYYKAIAKEQMKICINCACINQKELCKTCLIMIKFNEIRKEF